MIFVVSTVWRFSALHFAKQILQYPQHPANIKQQIFHQSSTFIKMALQANLERLGTNFDTEQILQFHKTSQTTELSSLSL